MPQLTSLSLSAEQRALVEAHLRLARALAWRFVDRGEAREDLEQVAYLALVRAARRYSPDRGVPFPGFAVPCILGELKRHFRDRSWGMRVGRRTQETYLAVKAASADLEQQLQRPPSVDEVATALGVADEDVLEAMEAGRNFWAAPLPVGADDDAGLLAEDDGYEHALELEALRQLVPRLDARSRAVLAYHYLDGMTQREIGEMLGVSQMQVSRLLSSALERLRALAS